MQILKGDNMKSITVEAVVNHTKSLCIHYYNESYSHEWYNIISNFTTSNLKSLKKYLKSIHLDFYNYFIIYTNEKEEDLLDLIEWLGYNESKLNCHCVLLTCR